VDKRSHFVDKNAKPAIGPGARSPSRHPVAQTRDSTRYVGSGRPANPSAADAEPTNAERLDPASSLSESLLLRGYGLDDEL